MKAPRPLPRTAEAGYSLVVLVIAVTVLNILVAAMLPLWSTAIKREKEEELIFRGFQYAEAIRVFRQRHSRPPSRLEELLEVKPRSIRQLWKDPMTEDGKWGLIFENQPQGGFTNQGDGRGPSGKEGEEEPEEEENGGPQLTPRKGQEVQIGPIIGVRSKSGDKAMLLFNGRERYDEWQFTETLLLTGNSGNAGNIQTGQGGAGVPGIPSFSTRWIGRPMRGITQQVPGLQDGTLPNGRGPGLNGPQQPPRSQRQPGGTSKPRGPS